MSLFEDSKFPRNVSWNQNCLPKVALLTVFCFCFMTPTTFRPDCTSHFTILSLFWQIAFCTINRMPFRKRRQKVYDSINNKAISIQLGTFFSGNGTFKWQFSTVWPLLTSQWQAFVSLLSKGHLMHFSDRKTWSVSFFSAFWIMNSDQSIGSKKQDENVTQ